MSALPNNALQQTARTLVDCRRSRFASGGFIDCAAAECVVR